MSDRGLHGYSRVMSKHQSQAPCTFYLEGSPTPIYQRLIDGFSHALMEYGHRVVSIDPTQFSDYRDYLAQVQALELDYCILTNPVCLLAAYSDEGFLFETVPAKLIFIHHDNFACDPYNPNELKLRLEAFQRLKDRSFHFCLEQQNVDDLRNLGIQHAHLIRHASEFEKLPTPESYTYDLSFVGHLIPHTDNELSELSYYDRLQDDFWKRLAHLDYAIAPAAIAFAQQTLNQPSDIDFLTVKYFYISMLHNLSHGFRGEVIKRIQNATVDIIGGDPSYINNIERDRRIIQENIRYHSPVNNYAKTCEIYANSRVNLNITSLQFDYAVINRVMDVGASGGFVLTDWKPDLEKLTSVSTEISYRTVDELNHKIEYYIHPDHDQERQDIAQVLHQEIKEKCTYPALIESILSVISVDPDSTKNHSNFTTPIQLQSPMKILVITNLYPPQIVGGYERSIADFSRLLHQRGHQVLVLTSNLESPFPKEDEAKEESFVWRKLLACGDWTEQGLAWLPPEQAVHNDQQNRQLIHQVLQDFQPQVCLAGNIDLLGIGLFEQLMEAGVPVAHYVMNATPNYPPEMAPQSPLHRYLTCSDWVRQNMKESGYPVETAEVVYPGAAVDDFYRAELPSHDRLRIAYASLVMHYKGADLLIEALCLLHAAGIPFEATIAGGTLYPKYVELLQEMVASEGLQDQVRFTGVLSRQELIDLYKTHNVLVFPSRFEEPFGISQIEAMAAGLTLITSGTGGAKEIVEHAQDGLLFERENSFDLADMLSSLVAYPQEWAAITRKGQQKALNQFSQTKAVEQLESVLSNLIALRQ